MIQHKSVCACVRACVCVFQITLLFVEESASNLNGSLSVLFNIKIRPKLTKVIAFKYKLLYT